MSSLHFLLLNSPSGLQLHSHRLDRNCTDGGKQCHYEYESPDAADSPQPGFSGLHSRRFRERGTAKPRQAACGPDSDSMSDVPCEESEVCRGQQRRFADQTRDEGHDISTAMSALQARGSEVYMGSCGWKKKTSNTSHHQRNQEARREPG